jgi:hypothetical protein
MRLIHCVPLLALTACCHGAALPEAQHFDMETIMDTFQDFVANPDPYMEAMGVRAKRDTENHVGFREFPIPFIGAEVGVKYKDQNNRRKGGEAFLHVDDLKSLIPAAHSREVKLHVKFDGGAEDTDGLFTAEIDYHLEHADGDGVEEGSLTLVREMRGGKWHTNLKTETKPFSGEPILPEKISNMQLDIESDRVTSFNAKYFNGPMNRDLKIDIVRVPGKSIEVTINNKGVTSTITGVLEKPNAKEIDIKLDANIRGVVYTGQISGKMQAGKATKVKVDIKKGQESVLQLQTEVKLAGNNGKFRGKYSIMGGKVAQGDYAGKYENGKFEFEAAPYKLNVDLKLGESIKVIATKDGQQMWTYSTLREDKSDANAIVYEATSEMTLNPASKLYGLIEKNYPFGAFQTRSNTFRIFIDKNNRNTVLRQFKINFDVIKDGNNVLDLVADTTSKPYNFHLQAPNLFQKLNIAQDDITVTIDHVRGDHLIIDANVAGGLRLEGRQAPNSDGGRSINIVTTKAGVQMLKYHADTFKTDTPAMFKVGLKGDLELNPESVLYRNLVGRYQILTPFAKRTSDLEFMWDRVNKNALINKFHVKAKIDKDATNVLNLDICTVNKPYKLYVFAPAILGKLRPGMTEVDVTVEHEAGQYLDMKVNHAGAKFKGFKIAKTGNGQEREIEWNGKKLGVGEYALTDNRFTTTQTLASGKSLTTTINWKNKWDSAAFLTDNKVSVVLDGTERKLNLDMDWNMAKVPDMDLSTPESGHFKMNGVGQNKRWGDYSISRDFSWSTANRKITVDLTGDASFGAGPLAARSPIQTEIKFTYDSPTKDLEGKFMKVMAGKEYSISFPRGSFKMPSIKIGA